MTVLLVATPGGHISELELMLPSLGLTDVDALWVTSRTPQTESMLAGQRVHWVDPIGSGDTTRALRGLPQALAAVRRIRPELVVSSGAAMAAPWLLAGARHRVPIWYVESATRTEGPSKTGLLAEQLPRTRLMVQGSGWGSPKWEVVDDVFSAFVANGTTATTTPAAPFVVSLGTERFPFSRALAGARRVLSGRDTIYQVGNTPGPPDSLRWMPSDDLGRACRAAPAVITHAGVGSALMALTSGKVPVLLPRRVAHGEHIDDHQLQLAADLERRGLAVVCEPEKLSWEIVSHAQSLGVAARHREPSTA